MLSIKSLHSFFAVSKTFASGQATSQFLANRFQTPLLITRTVVTDKEKEKAKKQKERERIQKLREKEREQKFREQEKTRVSREKEKEKILLAKEKAEQKAKDEKEKQKALRLKMQEREKKEKEKEKERRVKEKLAVEREKELEKKRKEKEAKALKPKKSRSAYVFYVSEKIGPLKAETPDSNIATLMKQLAEKWHNLPADEKKVFEDKAAQDKERRAQEVQKYEENRPKKPLGAYMLFSKDARAQVMQENAGASITEIAKLLGERWRALDASEKQTYVDKAKAMADEIKSREDL